MKQIQFFRHSFQDTGELDVPDRKKRQADCTTPRIIEAERTLLVREMLLENELFSSLTSLTSL